VSNPPATIHVLVIDDHPVVRFGLKPDVVLLDLELGDTHGVDALRQLREAAPSVRVVIYTSHDEEERIVQAAELGVDGYLLKGCPPQELLQAIRSVCEGGTALEASVAAKLMQHMNVHATRNAEATVHFSKRETQVLGLLASGKTNRDIGTTLFISESTVKFHVHAILNKLDAGNRTEAVSIAVKQGIITLARD